MGVPEISISFIEKGASAITRGERGVVALVLKDAVPDSGKVITVYSVSGIPEGLSNDNQQYIKDALYGYQNAPKKVIVYIMSTAADTIAEEYKAMMKYFEVTKFDWMAIPTAETDKKQEEIATWIKGLRENEGRKVKAVLPNSKADSEGVVNVTATLTRADGTTLTAEQTAPRIAGLIAGTPLTISCTYAPMPDFIDCERKTRPELNTAVDAGELVPMWDGEKVKICRGVNSFQTTTDSKGESFKKIKIVEIMDMIYDDISMTAQDSYIGKYANTYDNKCLLITSINAYFAELVREGLLQSGSCEINVDAQRNYLASQGEDADNMNDDEIKQANTGSKVFLKAVVSILDAMEDIELEIYI